MRKVLLLVLVGILLASCSQKSQESSKEEEVAAEKRKEIATENNEEKEKTEETKDEMLVTDGFLTKPGQYKEDETGKITLLKIKDLQQVKKIGPVELTITDVKILRQEASDRYFDEFLYQFTDKKQFDFVQIGVVVKNTTDEKITFDPVDVVVTSNGKQASKENDFYLQYLDQINSDYFGKVVKEGVYGIILDGVKGEEIDWIKIHTEPIWKSSNLEQVAEPIEIQVDF